MKYSLMILSILAILNISCSPEQVELSSETLDMKSQNIQNEEIPSSVEANQPTTTVSFDKMEYDFGTMNVGDKKETYFRLTNTGEEPLIISSAKGSCGCTVPDWPKNPIAPGDSEKILVVFTAKSEGVQTKTVTIQANTDPNPSRLKIKADVSKNSVMN